MQPFENVKIYNEMYGYPDKRIIINGAYFENETNIL